MNDDTPTGSSRSAVDSILTVTGATFEEQVLKADGRVVAEFMSYGCSYCRALEPVLQRVAEAVGPAVTIVRVNVPVEQALAARYNIDGTPTLVMFRDGAEIGRVEGLEPDMSTVLAAVTQPFEAVT
jgi:thioredoxin 1